MSRLSNLLLPKTEAPALLPSSSSLHPHHGRGHPDYGGVQGRAPRVWPVGGHRFLYLLNAHLSSYEKPCGHIKLLVLFKHHVHLCGT